MVGKEWFNASTQPAKSAQELHTTQVYQDPEFQKEVIKLQNTELNNENLLNLAKKYYISVENIKLFINGLLANNRVKRPLKTYDLRADGNGHWKAWINKDISKDEFLEMWAEIKRFKSLRTGKAVRKRPPDNPKLIYAIFKQRQLNPPTSFGNITKMYLAETLPYCDEKPKSTMTTQNLTREYNRYKPENKL
jgi:hypothetical protein